MGTSSRAGTRLISRSATDNISAINPSNASNRLQPRSTSTVDKSTSNYGLPLPFAISKQSQSVSVILRRYIKKLTDKDSSGKPSRIAQLFTAFKMGLYFKVFITVVLFLRFASHSSQRAYPNSSVSRDDHFISISSAPISPTFRIIVMTESGYSKPLKGLLNSLAAADYDKDSVDLDVWMFASSTCNYLPLPLYPLGMAIFGPPRFDHSIPPVVQSINWSHGQKTLIAVRSEPDWASVWEPSSGTANETILFVDATLTKSVSPSYYNWLKRAKTATKRGMVSNAGVFSLDSVNIPDGVPKSDRAVLLEEFFPSTAAFSPTNDAWKTFLKWYKLRTRSWFSRPRLNEDLSVGGYNLIESLRISPVKAYFTQFLDLYKERVVHPVLPENESLLQRISGTTGYRMKGIGVGHIQINQKSEYEANRYEDNVKDITVPENPILIKSNGHVSTADVIYGLNDNKIAGKTREAVLEDILDMKYVEKYRQVLRRIGEFARSRGSESISLTTTTESILDSTLSWLCNVIYLNIAPPAIVIITNDDKVTKSLKEFTKVHPKLEQGSLILTMENDIEKFKQGNKSKDELLLMLQRTFLLRDLIERGISILQFDSNEIWLSDPMPYIEHELRRKRNEDYEIADIIGTMNHDKKIVGSFSYIRATLSSRKLMSIVVNRYFLNYGKMIKFDDDDEERLINEMVVNKEDEFWKSYGGLKYNILNEELFVDGKWFSDFEDENGRKVEKRRYYKTEASLYPVILNNNMIEGIDNKKNRAKRFGFWFLEEKRQCDEESVKRAGRSGSIQEHREALVVELGRN